LNRVRQGHQYDEIEGVQLCQFPFSRQAQADQEEEINDHRAEYLFNEGDRQGKHIVPHGVHKESS